eukprot:CAMPEP_0202877680 /NCGR_PEP_ID=MMETSP1391-20130828/31023_1 /ASSEMBLY_ACC=CAM_ASM_000867 /TAXON_ID=1034604 /ORGANISM="Chlamydomonas leiostraca, Strain SAG 11-49" /LENGTH=58 /DNA_ID=CAMNT_0049559759 /DNA_START=108 /DNA_END=280 /DNA_ORIENTATION=+
MDGNSSMGSTSAASSASGKTEKLERKAGMDKSQMENQQSRFTTGLYGVLYTLAKEKFS